MARPVCRRERRLKRQRPSGGQKEKIVRWKRDKQDEIDRMDGKGERLSKHMTQSKIERERVTRRACAVGGAAGSRSSSRPKKSRARCCVLAVVEAVFRVETHAGQ